MDNLLSMLLSFPVHPLPQQPLSDKQYDESIRSQVERLRKVSDEQLLKLTSGGENVLDIINPALNTIPYAFALLAHARAVHDTFEAVKNNHSTAVAFLWRKILLFLESFDGTQIRYIGSETRDVVEAFAELARKLGDPGAAVAPIGQYMLRLDHSASTLTSTHLLLCQLAMESGAFSCATAVLNKDIVYFPSSNCGQSPQYLCSEQLVAHQYITPDTGLTRRVNIQDIQEYFLFAATVFIGLKQWERAAELLEHVILYPVKDSAVSRIMISAYNKLILVRILLKGKTLSLSRMLSVNSMKVFRLMSRPYAVVADLFECGPASRLREEILAGTTIWEIDGNTGLMSCILTAHQEHQVLTLADVYQTIPISRIAKFTCGSEPGDELVNEEVTKASIERMISRCDFAGSLGQSQRGEAFLSFNAMGSVSNESRMDGELIHALEQIKHVTDDIKTIERLLMHEKEYLIWTHKQKRSGDANSAKLDYTGEELGWTIGVDEDLMAA